MRQKTIEKIIGILNKLYRVEGWKSNPFKILISTVLSQRTKDEVTREASRKLFKVANTPEKILKLSEKRIAELIYPVGFYEQKAKRIKQICKILLEKYKGKVPDSREELMKLPGVGGKTADVVLCYGFGEDVIPVDVHVAVISRRLNLTKSKNPDKIREDLHETMPKKYRRIFNHLMVEFGKDICRTRNPLCYKCPIVKLCPYKSKNMRNHLKEF
ncbi:MAG: endonuclease III domain-containing protein [Candidatus Heimdallarchaeota archaeon]